MYTHSYTISRTSKDEKEKNRKNHGPLSFFFLFFGFFGFVLSRIREYRRVKTIFLSIEI
jgi:hypothetical protein